MKQAQDFCCSMEQAKRLKELGVTAESMFEYQDYYNAKYLTFSGKGVSNTVHLFNKTPGHLGTYPAYNVGELGLMLPVEVTTCKSHKQGIWSGSVSSPICFDMDSFEWKDWTTEAQARAEMLIYLLENNLITPSAVNDSMK